MEVAEMITGNALNKGDMINGNALDKGSMIDGNSFDKEIDEVGVVFSAYDCIPSIALRSTTTMGIPDILARSKKAMTAEDIVKQLPCKNPAAAAGYLKRIMECLIFPGIYSRNLISTADGRSEEAAYGLTPVSRLLVSDNVEFTLRPMALLFEHASFTTCSYHLHESVLEDRVPLEVAFGKTYYQLHAEDKELARIFQDAMSCHSKYCMKVIVHEYDGFNNTKTLVDIGGGEGEVIAELVEAYPHIHGINFDLPEVVKNAPQKPGVEHVGGDYFENIPDGDTIFLKWILHNSGDEECLKILKSCYAALPEEGGKVVIGEYALDYNSMDMNAQFVKSLDVIMLSLFLKGQERSFSHYQTLLTTCGFSRCKLIKLRRGVTLIEGYKN